MSYHKFIPKLGNSGYCQTCDSPKSSSYHTEPLVWHKIKIEGPKTNVTVFIQEENFSKVYGYANELTGKVKDFGDMDAKLIAVIQTTSAKNENE